ncbi:peptidase M1 membrane alanine aminopeptidase [Paenibacillus algicola]|uniref:Peptidase M1 membrane alanine aminopeptidase n=1 Tax=Paenibacillus algicola TaxID=2565926 RepID=A0A4P8XER7_9BACL|nr:M1 family metallopeptidase [Paenibacillus algicola]QCT00832.1 peptidase M1 membrane alanine aminopeptidase [Paenibacillus algicola]
MVPPRIQVFLSSMLALVMLAGAFLLIARFSGTADPAFGPESGTAPSAVKAPLSPPKVQPDLPAPALSNRLVEYHMDVRLTPEENQLTGTQTLTWTHPGKKAVTELYFHLYPNAFASKDTTFMKESGGRLRSDTMPQDGFGSMSITEVKTTDGLSLLHRLQYVQPDDGNINDQTLVKLRLPRPVKGGESITLHLGFQVELPKIFARMGSAGDFTMAGQWFPKLSVYEPAGTRGASEEGWNLHQYHGNSEFYADFGIYSVRIRVPEHYIVAATGFPTKSAVTSDGEKIYQFYADDVHDFAWVASPDFIAAEEAFSAPGVPGVKIKLYLDPLHKHLKDRYFDAAKAALKSYSKWYGTYPYSTLSIVVPPEEGNGAGGMEYPTLITAFGAKDDSPGYELERTVIHEIGHQYFYGMIASNEFEEAWLDEAFTSYAEEKVMELEYGLTPNTAAQAASIAKPSSLTQEAWKYGSHQHYAQNVYTRGKLVLQDIQRHVGAKTMERIMKAYAQKYRFKHPTTADFQQVVEQITESSWQSYFDHYVYGAQMMDVAVESIEGASTGTADHPSYTTTVTLSSRGGPVHQVPVTFAFENGETIRRVWDGSSEAARFKVTSSSPLIWAMADPDYTMVLENKHVNNYLKAGMEAKQVTRWNLSVTKLIETLYGALSW